jgi:hypothetical protein
MSIISQGAFDEDAASQRMSLLRNMIIVYRLLKIMFPLIFVIEAFISVDWHEGQLLFSLYLRSRKILLPCNLIPCNFEGQTQFVYRIIIPSSLDHILCIQRGRWMYPSVHPPNHSSVCPTVISPFNYLSYRRIVHPSINQSVRNAIQPFVRDGKVV